MSWKLIALGVAVLLVLAVILPRKSVHAEHVIEATPSEVWSVIADPASYPEWNQILVQVSGTFAVGAEMDIAMKMGSDEPVPVTATVRHLEPERWLNQAGGTTGILTFDHHWRLEPEGSGTRVTQHENYRGIGVLFWDPSGVEDLYEQGLTNLEGYLAAQASSS